MDDCHRLVTSKGQTQVQSQDHQQVSKVNDDGRPSCRQFFSLHPRLFITTVFLFAVIAISGIVVTVYEIDFPVGSTTVKEEVIANSKIFGTSDEFHSRSNSSTDQETPGADCFRNCSSDPETQKTCKFHFKMENFWSLSSACVLCGTNDTRDCSHRTCIPLDGTERPLAVVNRSLPGPAIRVCHNDLVVVDLENDLLEQGTGIHWHGQEQTGTPWMDGVPHLSHCPIQSGNFFRYRFRAENPGTHFWHSHAGTQRADGVFGSFVVRRELSKEPHGPLNGNLYQFDLPEHELIVMDWMDQYSVKLLLENRNLLYRNRLRQILLNGRGLPYNFTGDFQPGENLQNTKKYFVPIHRVWIRPGFSYRWRIISNGLTACPIEFSIENHTMTIIASDGHELEPVKVSSFDSVIHGGERYDVVVTGNQPVGSYWIKLKGLLNCEQTRAFNLGVLNYVGVPNNSYPTTMIRTYAEAGAPRDSFQINPADTAPGIVGRSKTMAELSSFAYLDDDPEIVAREKPDAQYYLSFDFNTLLNYDFEQQFPDPHADDVPFNFSIAQLNYITNVMPPIPPAVQPNVTTSSDVRLCNETSVQGQNCTSRLCACTHWIKVDLNSIVELVLVDRGYAANVSHPFHLHGHAFRIVAMEKLGIFTEPEVIRQLDEKGQINRRRGRAVIKDTVSVPDGGYTIIRFRANNPGVWLFHCHLEFHAEVGMGLIFQVGEMDDMPKAQKDFPQCGHYRPDSDSGSSINSVCRWSFYSIFLLHSLLTSV